MSFFVELPADEYGNRAWTNGLPCVVEGYLVESDIGLELIFVAPLEIKSKWPSVLFNQYGGWLEVDGPARTLTWEEREVIIARAHTMS
jgi:hypothetical protein